MVENKSVVVMTSIMILLGAGMNTAWCAIDHGLQVSGLKILPNITIGRTHDDNVFSQQDDPVADNFLTIEPSLSIVDDWRRGTVSLNADLTSQRYDEQESQDRDDYHLGLEAKIEVAGAQFLEFSGLVSHVAEDQNSSENFRGDSLIMADEKTLSVGYSHIAGWLGVSVFGAIDSFDYRREGSDTELDGTDLRNRDESSVTGKISYGPVGKRQIYLRLQGGRSVHDVLDEDPALNRDASFRQAGTGFNFSDDGPLSVKAEVGLYRQEFEGEALGNIDGLYHKGAVYWQMTPLTELKLSSSRSFQQTGTRSSAGYEETIHRARLRHELTRFIEFEVTYEWGTDSYFGIKRDDDMSGYSIEARYSINRYLELYAGLSSTERTRISAEDLSADDFTYKKQEVTLGSTFRL